MKLLRRSLVLCLSLILCLSVFIVSAGAAGETFTVSYDDGGVSYSFTFKVVGDGKVNISALNYTSGTTLTIPGKVTKDNTDYTVAGIENFALVMDATARGSVKSIIIEEGFESIPVSAFAGYSALETITIPGSVTSIGTSAFSGCSSLKKITIPASYNGDIRNIVFSSGTTTLVIDPEILDFEAGSPYSNVDGVLYKTVDGGVRAELLLDRDATTITIKEGTTEIASNAFSNTNLSSVTFSGTSLKKIGSSAFSGCKNLTSLTLPNGVEEIGLAAFKGCSSLSSLSLPYSLTTIGAGAFGGCDALMTLTIPANVEDGLFEALTGEVGNGSGEYPHLDGVKLAEGSPYSIEDGVLYKGTTLVYLLDRDAESIEVKAGTTEIAENAFLFSSGAVSSRLKSVTFADNSLKVIGPSAFFGCAIEEIDLPSSVTTIGESAFEGCSYLKRVTLPAGVTTISNSAFETCTSLETIDLSNVTAIGAEAFKNCTSLSRVSLPEGLKTIGESAFYFSSTGNFGDGLEYINIPSTVTSLGDQFATMTGEGVVVSAVADADIFTSKAISGFGEAVLIYPEEYAEAYKNNEALTGAGIVAQEGDDDITYALSLDPPSLNLLDVGTKTISVTATIPAGYKLVMSNSNDNVAGATLSDDGTSITVTAKSAGSATISVSIVSNDDSITLVTKSCDVVVGASYTVTIVYGNGAADDIVYIAQGESYKLPAAPSNSGYIFLGWRGADGRTYKTGDVVEISGDTTFKAVWGNLPDVTEPSEPETPDTPVFPFYDVTARDWYYSAVKYVYEKGLMDGVDVGVFAPNDTLTRAMVWTIIARAEGVDTTGGATWYAKAQEWVTAKGISDGENPTAAITRQELVTMLYRLAGEPAVSGTITAPDTSSVSSWAQNAMTWAMSTSLIEGDENGAVTPTATATRAQAAAIFMRFIENIK